MFVQLEQLTKKIRTLVAQMITAGSAIRQKSGTIRRRFVVNRQIPSVITVVVVILLLVMKTTQKTTKKNVLAL